jgi:hypothetical protein
VLLLLPLASGGIGEGLALGRQRASQPPGLVIGG